MDLLAVAAVAGACTTGDGADGNTPPNLTEPVPLMLHWAGSAVYGDALVTGVLVEERGCILLKRSGSRSLLVIWPPGFEALRTQQGVVILDESGTPFARTGESIALGGKRVLPKYIARHSEPDPTGLCPASGYWVASPERATFETFELS